MSASPAFLLLATTLCTPGALGVPANQRYDSPPREDRLVAATAVAAQETVSPTQPAKGRFLVATHSLADRNFSETAVLLLAYEPTGAMGVVINRPTDVRLGSVLRDVQELRDRPDPVYLGGPVAANLLVVLIRAAQQPESSEAIFEGVYISGSRAALREALRKAGKRNRVRVYAGHAGWGPGQLDREIARGDWHVTAADATVVFDMTPSAIWPKLIQRFSGEWTRRETPTEPHSPWGRGRSCGVPRRDQPTSILTSRIGGSAARASLRGGPRTFRARCVSRVSHARRSFSPVSQ